MPAPFLARPRRAPAPLRRRHGHRCSTRAGCRSTPASTCSTSTDPKIVQSIHAEYIRPAPTASRRIPSGPTASSSGMHGAAGRRARDQPARGAAWRATSARAWGATSSCSAPSGRSASTWPRSAPSSRTEARAAFLEQAEGLLEGGVDALRHRDLLRPRGDAAGGGGDARADRPADRGPGGVHR